MSLGETVVFQAAGKCGTSTWRIAVLRLLKLAAHTAERSGAERPAACVLIRGNKAVDLFPRIKSQAAGRSAVCVPLECLYMNRK
jgi:hypothetical protein